MGLELELFSCSKKILPKWSGTLGSRSLFGPDLIYRGLSKDSKPRGNPSNFPVSTATWASTRSPRAVRRRRTRSGRSPSRSAPRSSSFSSPTSASRPRSRLWQVRERPNLNFNVDVCPSFSRIVYRLGEVLFLLYAWTVLQQEKNIWRKTLPIYSNDTWWHELYVQGNPSPNEHEKRLTVQEIVGEFVIQISCRNILGFLQSVYWSQDYD